MTTREVIEKTRQYLDYIERHYDNVQRAWGEIQEKCGDVFPMTDDILWGVIDSQIKTHDVSKLSQAEFVPYRLVFYPTLAENTGPDDMKDAWEHHKKYNRHHWQTWARDKPMEESFCIDCIHMLVDWMAMSYEFGGTARSYYENNCHKIELPDDAIALMNVIFDRVYGEKIK